MFLLNVLADMIYGPFDAVVDYVFPYALHTKYQVSTVVLIMHAAFNVALMSMALGAFITVYTTLNALYQKVFNTTSNAIRTALRMIAVLALLLFAVTGCIAVLFHQESLHVYWMWVKSHYTMPMGSLDSVIQRVMTNSVGTLYGGAADGAQNAAEVLNAREL